MGACEGRGWGCGRRELLTLDHSDGCQGGSENAEAWFVPAAPAGEPSWGLSLIFRQGLPAGPALSFLPGLPWEDMGTFVLGSRKDIDFLGWYPGATGVPGALGNEV